MFNGLCDGMASFSKSQTEGRSFPYVTIAGIQLLTKQARSIVQQRMGSRLWSEAVGLSSRCSCDGDGFGGRKQPRAVNVIDDCFNPAANHVHAND